MPDLVLLKLSKVSSEVEHHRIAKILKLATIQTEITKLEIGVVTGDKLVELKEAKTEALQLESELISEGVAVRVSMQEYNHSVGLIMGREIVISALPENLNDLERKVIAVSKVR